MTIPEHIPTELIQRFTPAQAWEYFLVPFEMRGGSLVCLGERGRDYTDVLLEIEVLYGMVATVEETEGGELQKFLRRYYRSESPHGTDSNGTSAYGTAPGISATHAVAPGTAPGIAAPYNTALDRQISAAGGAGAYGQTTAGSADRSPRSVGSSGDGRGFLMGLVEEAFDTTASDIHIETYEERCRVRFRIDGKLIERYVIEKGNYASLVNQIKIISGLDISEKRLPQDGRILYDRNGRKFDVRVSCLPTIYGEKIVMRLLTRHIELLELANLGFTERQLSDYCRAVERPHGMILICGPTGSGKSTTLYATLRRLNRLTDNILTIEDPVEYTLEGVNQVQLKEEIGLTFTSALRTFLRQDPDIIMLGEIRDADTASMAIRSSLTGHLIFSTIHTNTAWGSIARLVDMGIHPYLVAGTLVMCVAQRLVRLLCPHCKRLEEAGEEIRRVLPDGEGGEDGEGNGCGETANHYVAVGCDRCYWTGYSGRRAIYEVIPVDDELAAAARNQDPDIGEKLRQRNIITLREAAIEMFRRGETSLEEIVQIIKS